MRPVVIHSLDDARAALATAAAGTAAILHSAPDAGVHGGVAWFERMVAAAHGEFPQVPLTAVLDCGDAAGAVLEAVRWLKEPGREKIMLRFTGDAETARRLADIAGQAGIELVREPADVTTP
ncbi:MAG TPA: hypothetical protein VMQ11_09860 [Alphaproteobacteria bacterium]|nr:hypothetical protein [Alphaproteobacteria bacterium]